MSSFWARPIKITYPSQIQLIENAKNDIFDHMKVGKLKITASAQLRPIRTQASGAHKLYSVCVHGETLRMGSHVV